MPDQPYHVYAIQGRGRRDDADCQAALPFIGDEDALITRARDADGLVISSAPVTRNVLSALEGLKVVRSRRGEPRGLRAGHRAPRLLVG